MFDVNVVVANRESVSKSTGNKSYYVSVDMNGRVHELYCKAECWQYICTHKYKLCLIKYDYSEFNGSKNLTVVDIGDVPKSLDLTLIE